MDSIEKVLPDNEAPIVQEHIDNAVPLPPIDAPKVTVKKPLTEKQREALAKGRVTRDINRKRKLEEKQKTAGTLPVIQEHPETAKPSLYVATPDILIPTEEPAKIEKQFAWSEPHTNSFSYSYTNSDTALTYI